MPSNRENARPNEWESEEEQENTLILFAITAVCFLVLASMVGISYYSGQLSNPLPTTKIEKNEADPQIDKLINEIKMESDSEEVDCPDYSSDLDIEKSLRELERTLPANRTSTTTNSERLFNPLVKPVASGKNKSGSVFNAAKTNNPITADKPAANSSNSTSAAADTKHYDTFQQLRFRLGPNIKISHEVKSSAANAANAVDPNTTQLNDSDSTAQPKQKKAEEIKQTTQHQTIPPNPQNKKSNRRRNRF